jgi:hypothetical protein
MKFVRTVIVFDRGALIDSAQWAQMHSTYTQALQRVEHPPGIGRFVIRRKTLKPQALGKKTDQWQRNGVKPIRDQFLKHLTDLGWRKEQPAGLESKSEQILAAQEHARAALKEYPSKRDFSLDDESWEEIFHQKVGDFDFYTELPGKMRCVVEWETGNVSSTHRSMNKLCLVMLAGLIDIGVVILPSRLLYTHLTDRIANWMEISPYLPLWHRIAAGVPRGLLAVTVVEHDEITDDPSVPFIGQGSDGRSAEGAAKLL